MSEFAGVIRLDGDRPDASFAERLAHGLDGPGVDGPRIWREGPALLVHRQSHELPEDTFDRQPISVAPGLTLVADIRIDDRKALARELGLDPVQQAGDAALLAAALIRWGETALVRLYGDFAFALWDARESRLTLARDALGVRTLYYAYDSRFIAFATRLRALLSLPEIPRDLDELAVADLLTLTPANHERTLYHHIHRVPSGGTVTFSGPQRSIDTYWSLDRISPIRLRRDDDYVEAARELLDGAVENRLRRAGPIAAMLSGGFNSAGVTATAAKLLGEERLTAYTRVPGAPHPYDAIDERALAAKVVARYPNIDWVVVDDDTPALRDSEPESEAPLMALPQINAFNPTWFEPILQRAVKSGAKVLLNGAMGNPVLSWHGETFFGELCRGGRWLTAVTELRRTAQRQQYSFLKTLRRYAIPALEPRALRRWRHGRNYGGFPALGFSVASPEFLAAVDYARHARDIGHDLPFHPARESRQARATLLLNERSRDLAGIARLRYGIERRDPYTDRRFVEFAMAIPDDQFYCDGQSRWLGRRVLADRLPQEILSQTHIGWQCPEWHHLASRRLDKTAEAIARIERSPLASRVLDVKRMKQLFETWPKNAEAARGKEMLYQHALHRGIIVGSFLRWFEGGNA